MLASPEPLATIANQWLARFERALAQSDATLLASLFHRDSHWRDVLALTWNITTVDGAEALLGLNQSASSLTDPALRIVQPAQSKAVLRVSRTRLDPRKIVCYGRMEPSRCRHCFNP